MIAQDFTIAQDYNFKGVCIYIKGSTGNGK
jgi:hypothetical protein